LIHRDIHNISPCKFYFLSRCRLNHDSLLLVGTVLTLVSVLECSGRNRIQRLTRSLYVFEYNSNQQKPQGADLSRLPCSFSSSPPSATMRSHGRHKRSKSNKDADTEMYMNMQAGDDVHTEDYTRSRNSAEQYRSTSRSSRATYGSDRDRVPHSHREDDWHRAAYDHDRYTYGDIYSRGGGDRLDDYDDGRRGDSVGWRGVDPNPYPPGHDWSHHYEHVGTSSYAEPSSLWAVSPPVYESSRSSYVGHWQDRESRDLPVDDWEPTGLRSDRTHDRRQDWRHEGRREKNSQPKFQNDSNWGRRREGDWTHETPTQSNFPMDERQDRSWEPAASWKSSNRNNHQQQHQTHRTQNGQRHNGKSKRNHNQNKQRREWRQADDGDLNKYASIS